jgi:plastocyanin
VFAPARNDVFKKLALCTLVFIAFAACSSHESAMEPQASGGDAAVNVDDNNYSPSSTAVVPGASVTWKWRGANLHSVTFDDGGASSVQRTGDYKRTFQNAGSFAYHCSIHGLAMSGTITVR